MLPQKIAVHKYYLLPPHQNFSTFSLTTNSSNILSINDQAKFQIRNFHLAQIVNETFLQHVNCVEKVTFIVVFVRNQYLNGHGECTFFPTNLMIVVRFSEPSSASERGVVSRTRTVKVFNFILFSALCYVKYIRKLRMCLVLQHFSASGQLLCDILNDEYTVSGKHSFFIFKASEK